MRINPRRFWELFFLAMLCACLLMLCWHGLESRQAHQIYQEAARLVSAPNLPEPVQSPPPIEKISDSAPIGMDLSPLRAVNPDVVCWVEIPGVLSYPVLQGEDNSFYLSHAWDGEKNTAGAVFLDCRATPDLTDFHTLLYGHRMRDGSMFGSLKQYADDGFWREHPSIYLSDEGGTRRYDIFAAYEVGVTEIVYRQGISSTEDRRELVQFGLDRSIIETEITPAPEDRIITLSTCTGRGYGTRWVVQAVLGREK